MHLKYMVHGNEGTGGNIQVNIEANARFVIIFNFSDAWLQLVIK